MLNSENSLFFETPRSRQRILYLDRLHSKQSKMKLLRMERLKKAITFKINLKKKRYTMPTVLNYSDFPLIEYRIVSVRIV